MNQTRIEVTMVCVLNDDGKFCCEKGADEIFTEALKYYENLTLDESEYGCCKVHIGLDGENDSRYDRVFRYPNLSPQ